jgi:hypothetical protein
MHAALCALLVLLFSSGSWATPLPHGSAPLPPIAIEPHTKPNTVTRVESTGPQLSAQKPTVQVVVVGCRLTPAQVAQETGPVMDAFGAARVRIGLRYVAGDEGVLCEPNFIDSDTTTALENITGLFNNDPNWGAWRTKIGADLVVLLRPVAPNANLCGVAWQNNSLDAAYGFAVVELNTCDNNDPYTMAHELGHLFGASHGPKSDPVPGIYRFSNAFDGYNRKGQWLHTLMSSGYSGSPLYPRFSAPGLTRLNGHFNNKLTLQLTAPVIARFR